MPKSKMPTLPKTDEHWCRFYIDIEGKLKAKQRDQVCDLVLAALQAAEPKLAKAITDIEATTCKRHKFDAEKGVKIKSGPSYKALYVEATIDGTARQVDRMLQKAVPILFNMLTKAGFEINHGWGERRIMTKANMMDM